MKRRVFRLQSKFSFTFEFRYMFSYLYTHKKSEYISEVLSTSMCIVKIKHHVTAQVVAATQIVVGDNFCCFSRHKFSPAAQIDAGEFRLIR